MFVVVVMHGLDKSLNSASPYKRLLGVELFCSSVEASFGLVVYMRID